MSRLHASLPLMAALLIPTAWSLSGAEPGAPRQISQSEMHAQMSALQAEVQELVSSTAAPGALPEAPFSPNAPMPQPPPGQSAVIADGGLVIDNENSKLVYIGNVRLSDPHLQLRAAQRLYIHLPKADKKKPAADPATAQPTEAQAPAPEPAGEQPATTPGEELQPAHLTVDSAAVDAQGSRVLLEGLQNAHPSLLITRGDDRITLFPAEDGAPARVFANAEGEVLAEGGRMIFIWRDEANRSYKLEAATGPVTYSAREQTLCVLGQARLSSDTAAIECDKQLRIYFKPAEKAPAAKENTPFSAFATLQFKEISSAYAEGGVVLTTPATPTRPAGTAKGDHLVYHAADSSCTLSGKCSLSYGDYTLRETDDQGKLHIAEDGSISLSAGSALTGTYTRPSGEGEQPLTGTWQSGSSLSYAAEGNCITIPGGFRAQDASASFSSSGTVQLFLEPRPGAKPLAHKPGLPHLVIAQQGGVRRVVARDSVRLHADPAGSRLGCDISADMLDATIPTGEATLTAGAGRSAEARYGDYELIAHAAAEQEGQALIQLQANGDILATGERVSATLPVENGTVRAACATSLHLQRSEAQLTLGPDSRIESPDGILTAHEPLLAELVSDEAATRRAPKGYPQLAYAFTGLRRASTDGGGTLRTTQASLQCEGAMAIELAQGAPGKDPRKALRSATARGRVAIAGKDATGRLMRANGDRLDYDPATGNFYLRGNTVTLMDRYNTHTATGGGACVTIDPHNNVHITGKKQTTSAHHLLQQMETNKKK